MRRGPALPAHFYCSCPTRRGAEESGRCVVIGPYCGVLKKGPVRSDAEGTFHPRVQAMQLHCATSGTYPARRDMRRAHEELRRSVQSAFAGSAASAKYLGPHQVADVLRLGGFGVMLRASRLAEICWSAYY